jgi:para-nitrobenzyl esterase
MGKARKLASLGTNPVTVMTESGLVRGEAKDNHRQFLGLPYAAPPIGDLRWAPPRPLAPWHGILDATQLRSKCAQGFGAAPGQFQGSEDCLYLNVYTPTRNNGAGLKPVMVWIHGGGWTLGASQDSDSSTMAVKGDVVVVTINYRLGAFAFYTSPSLSAESPQRTSGNYAIRDEQAALRWVKRNIRNFGGDPNQVTLAGESAGAISGWIHLVAPSSTGLFQKMIAQSGPLPLDPPAGTEWTRGLGGTQPIEVEQSEGSSSLLAASVGCDLAADELACLRSKSTGDIVNATRFGNWGPVVDKVLIPDSVPEMIKRGAHKRLPVLAGSNRGESSFGTLIRLASGGHPLTVDEYNASTLARPNGSQILAQYPAADYASPDDAAIQYSDDVFMCSATLRTAKTLRARLPLYIYQFQDDNPPPTLFDVVVPPDIHPRAFHTAEITYVFQSGYPGELRPGDPPFTPAQAALSDRMIRYWSNFMKSGRPGLAWKPFNDSSSVFLLNPQGDEITTARVLEGEHRCGFWGALSELRVGSN